LLSKNEDPFREYLSNLILVTYLSPCFSGAGRAPQKAKSRTRCMVQG